MRHPLGDAKVDRGRPGIDAGAVYFDALSNHPNLRWSLSGPQGSVVTARAFTSSGGNNISCNLPILHLFPGDYTLTIEATSAATPSYAFNLADLASATLITPGAPVSGSMTPDTNTDFYQFTAAAGDRIQLDQTSRVNLTGAAWRLLDPIDGLSLGREWQVPMSYSQRAGE